MNEKEHAVRLYSVACMLSVAMLGLGVRIGFLHLGPHEPVRAGILKSRTTRRELLFKRGRVFDRNGNLLALDIGGKDVCADPALIVTNGYLHVVASRLGAALHCSPDRLVRTLNQPQRRFAYVERYVPDERVRAVESLGLPGVFFRDVQVRHYPKASLLCHVLGFCNYERVGCAGIEQAMESYIRGSPGVCVIQRDGRRHEVPGRRLEQTDSRDGADVTLNVDQAIQYMVERALDRAMQQHKPKAACVIVQRVLTGEILAMASRPGYTPNAFRATTAAERRNRAIASLYEPGSTMKVVTIAAALEAGCVGPDTVFDCENGEWFYGGWPLRDHHPFTKLSVADGLKKSSNILVGKVAVALGKRRLEKHLRAFGFGRRLGIDLPGEEAGLLAPCSAWSAVSTTRIGIGQGVAVTALQMLGAICAVANDGFLMRPYVVAQVSTGRARILLQPEPRILGRPIRQVTAARMRRLLRRVTEEGGTGTGARVAGYRVAGKTGTAQKVVDGKYSNTAFVASFVGFLPADRPEIGIIVVMDEPGPLHTGGAVAAPVFSAIASQAIRYLDVPPCGNTYARAPERSL